MATIPKKVIERFIKQTGKYQRVLKQASDNDINESDTVIIVTDILADIFGYAKYTETTSEYAIRGTYCDLAIKIKDDIKFLIEVKSISNDLKEHHLKQAVDYGAHEGIQWVILTNGYAWRGYNIILKDTVEFTKIFEFDFQNINARKSKDQELLFVLAKEGLSKDAISEYKERVQSINRHVISALVLSQPILDIIRRELRKLTPGLRVDTNEIESIIANEIIKRNVIDHDSFKEAQRKIKRHFTKMAKSK